MIGAPGCNDPRRARWNRGCRGANGPARSAARREGRGREGLPGVLGSAVPAPDARYNPPMNTAPEPLPVDCRSGALGLSRADLLCAPFFEDDDDLSELDVATAGAIGRARASGELTGKPHELYLTDVVDAGWGTRRVLLVGAGPRDAWTADRAREVAGTAGLAARGRKARRVKRRAWPPGLLPAHHS